MNTPQKDYEDEPQGDFFGDRFDDAEPTRLPKVKPMPTSRDVSKDAPPPAYAARPADLSDRGLLEEIELVLDADEEPAALNTWEADDFLPSIMKRFKDLPQGINSFLTPKQRACVIRIYQKICD